MLSNQLLHRQEFVLEYAVVDVLFFFKATIIKTSYLGVFRRHFAPAIVLKKTKQPNCPQPTCLFPLRGQDDKKRYSGALWRVIVPWTLSGPDAHPRSRSEGIPHCFSVTGWGLWRAESPLPPWNQQQNEQQQRLPVRSARLCRVEAQEPRVDQT